MEKLVCIVFTFFSLLALTFIRKKIQHIKKYLKNLTYFMLNYI